MATTFENLDHGFGISGMTTADILLEITFEDYTGPTANNRTILSGQWDEAGGGSGYVYQSGGNNILQSTDVSSIELDGVGISNFAPADVTGGNVFSCVVSGHGGDLVVANRWSLDEPINCQISAVTVKSADGTTTLHTFDLSSPSSTSVPDTTGSATGELLNFTLGPSISAADNVSSEGQSRTITLAGNSNAPTVVKIGSATLDGADWSYSAATKKITYTAPLLPDNDTLTVTVTVDSTNVTTSISYANSYDRDQLTHAEPNANSLNYGNQYGTTEAYEWKVVTDADSGVVVIDWDALEAADGLNNDIATYSTTVAEGETTVTIGYYIPETGESGSFSRTIYVNESGVVVETGRGRRGFLRPCSGGIKRSIVEGIAS